MRSTPAVPLPATAVAARGVSKAFGYVAYTLVVSGLAALATTVTHGWFWGSFAVGLVCLLTLSVGIAVLSLPALRLTLTGFAISEGVFWAFVAQRAGAEDLLTAALIAGGIFAALAAYGYRTRRELSAWGSFLFAVLMGLLAVWVVVSAVGAGVSLLVLSAVGVLLFSAYTAHDVHEVRVMAPHCTSEEELSRLALICGVNLYLDLANLVIDVLNFIRSDVLGSVADFLGGW